MQCITTRFNPTRPRSCALRSAFCGTNPRSSINSLRQANPNLFVTLCCYFAPCLAKRRRCIGHFQSTRQANETLSSTPPAQECSNPSHVLVWLSLQVAPCLRTLPCRRAKQKSAQGCHARPRAAQQFCKQAQATHAQRKCTNMWKHTDVRK